LRETCEYTAHFKDVTYIADRSEEIPHSKQTEIDILLKRAKLSTLAFTENGRKSRSEKWKRKPWTTLTKNRSDERKFLSCKMPRYHLSKNDGKGRAPFPSRETEKRGLVIPIRSGPEPQGLSSSIENQKIHGLITEHSSCG